MQRLEVSGALRPIYGSLGVKRLIKYGDTSLHLLKWKTKSDTLHQVREFVIEVRGKAEEIVDDISIIIEYG